MADPTPRSTDVTIPAAEGAPDGIVLTGTLVVPADATGTAVLLVNGSGPLDRDGDAKRSPLGVSRLLAEALADQGTASLRYDKRGVGGSGGSYLAAGVTDNIADAATALRWLRAQPGVDRVVVVGHSEGALIALQVAVGEDPAPDGIVLLAGAAQTGEAVLHHQMAQVGDDIPAPVRGLLRLLRIDLVATQVKRIARLRASTTDVIRMQGVRVNARWFREFLDLDPAEALRDLDVPTLAVTGARDIQVDPADVEVMRGLVTAPFEGHVVEGVTHILRRGSGSPRTYRKELRAPLDHRVVEAVTGWISRLPAAAG